ncbi:MAG: hypothetical protein WCP68_11225, partial [Enhydrobacter sp.]
MIFNARDSSYEIIEVKLKLNQHSKRPSLYNQCVLQNIQYNKNVMDTSMSMQRDLVNQTPWYGAFKHRLFKPVTAPPFRPPSIHREVHETGFYAQLHMVRLLLHALYELPSQYHERQTKEWVRAYYHNRWASEKSKMIQRLRWITNNGTHQRIKSGAQRQTRDNHGWTISRKTRNRLQHTTHGNHAQQDRIVISRQTQYIVVPYMPLEGTTPSQTEVFSDSEFNPEEATKPFNDQIRALMRSLRRSKAENRELKDQIKRIRLESSLPDQRTPPTKTKKKRSPSPHARSSHSFSITSQVSRSGLGDENQIDTPTTWVSRSVCRDDASEQATTASPPAGSIEHNEDDNEAIVADRPTRLNLETRIKQNEDRVSQSQDVEERFRKLELHLENMTRTQQTQVVNVQEQRASITRQIEMLVVVATQNKQTLERHSAEHSSDIQEIKRAIVQLADHDETSHYLDTCYTNLDAEAKLTPQWCEPIGGVKDEPEQQQHSLNETEDELDYEWAVPSTGKQKPRGFEMTTIWNFYPLLDIADCDKHWNNYSLYGAVLPFYDTRNMTEDDTRYKT